MVNVAHKVSGTKLIIEVNLEERNGPSRSGNTEIIGSTQGNINFTYKGKSIGFGVNVWEKPAGRPAPKAA